jgi:hypothetical protein
MVISVSRRCDIPRFSFDWFLKRLDVGYADVANPFNPDQLRHVSLLPPAPERTPAESAELFAFWTRDPAAILKYAEELKRRGVCFYVMTTINSYPAILEPNLPPAFEVINTIKALAVKISNERLIWRYDPVLLTSITDFDFHRRNFAELASRLNGAVAKVIVSVYDEYARAEKRLSSLEQSGALKRLPHYTPEDKAMLPAVRELLSALALTAKKEGMQMQGCAEEDLSDFGIKPGACIDGEYIEKHFGLKIKGKDRNQKRPGCLCAQSVDIGSYGNCPAACVYCYGLRRSAAM